MKGEKRGPSKKKAPSTFFKPAHRSQLNGAASRSITASPALGASRSPFPFGASQTSVPAVSSEETLKLAALKSALLHVLAIRPTTLKHITKTIRCSPSECEKLFSTYTQPSRDDPSKSDLDPKAYKELDIWKFPYQSETDRQAAIDRAVKSFDKLRITPSDELWQQLLPKHDRGKGISLSKLDFRNGPLQKVSTPVIHVENTDHAALTDGSEGKSDKQSRLHPRDPETESLSPAVNPAKKRKISEKEAQMKRLSKNPPKKAAVKEPKAKKEPKATVREKKEGKKGSPKIMPKIKSAEFVHDSDEDEVMENLVPETANGKESPKAALQTTSKVPVKVNSKSAIKTEAEASAKATTSNPKKGATGASENPAIKGTNTKMNKGALTPAIQTSNITSDKGPESPTPKPATKSNPKSTTKPTVTSTTKLESKAETMTMTEAKTTTMAKPVPTKHSPMSNVTKPKIRKEVLPDKSATGSTQQKKMALGKKTAVESKGVNGKKVDTGKNDAVNKKVAAEKGDAKRKEILAAAEKKPIVADSPQLKPVNSPNPATTTSNARPSASTMRRTFSHQRNTSSPLKPSPLASSPPTNASELDHKIPGYQASSTKTTPNTSSSGTKDSPPSQPVHPKGVARKIGPPTSNPVSVKRKADALDHDSTTKPKLNGLARANTVNEAKKATLSADKPTKDNVASPHPNKKHQTHHPSSTVDGRVETPTVTKATSTAKGPKAASVRVVQKPPTPSPTPSLSESASPPPSSLLGESRVEKALRFKKYHAEYEKLHLRLQATEPAERDRKQMEKLMRMRQVLSDLKTDLGRKG